MDFLNLDLYIRVQEFKEAYRPSTKSAQARHFRTFLSFLVFMDLPISLHFSQLLGFLEFLFENKLIIFFLYDSDESCIIYLAQCFDSPGANKLHQFIYIHPCILRRNQNSDKRSYKEKENPALILLKYRMS